ncbi:MAG: glycosyltransferase [Luteitalea sp.]|nr:glycosyltransferase [Luteitalea sp.]
MQEVCIVIPCFNEARRLGGDDLLAFLSSSPHAHLCLVDDGSTDGTLEALRHVQRREPGRIHVLRLEQNTGKAQAVRAGVLHVASLESFAFIGYWDADLSTPLGEVDHLLEALNRNPSCQLALGSRVKRLGSSIERRPGRHVLGRIFAACASGILGVSVYDSQCGAKIFRTGVVPTLFREPFLTRWLFDLEMLVRLRGRTGTLPTESTIEVPLRRWREMGGSKLTVRDMIRVPRELLAIRKHYQPK